MKTPTLEEVKEYFKNAKEVRCLADKNIYKTSNLIISEEKNKEVFFVFKPNGLELSIEYRNKYCVIWDIEKGYAEIVSYIEPQFTLTKGQLSYLHSIDSVKETIEEWFPSEFKKVPIEITIEEIAKLKGVDVSLIKIVK